jgi:FAD/FMN-containing dehydrogenase
VEKLMSADRLASALRPDLGNRVLVPGTAEYEDARQVWNGMYDRRPALIVRCVNSSEVSASLRRATAAGVPVTIRGGGHNVAGTAVADDALMIDLSLMRAVTVDPAAQVAQAQGGCLLRDVDTAAAAVGLACPVGVVPDTGLAGLALGGGYGWLARKWGLTCDHILAAEVVLADGEIVEAADGQHADLLWALRGGGGNFGVVTRLTLRLRPVSAAYYHAGLYPWEGAAQALAAYREFAETQPADLHVVGALKYPGRQDWIPPELTGDPVLILRAVWFGDPGHGVSAVAPLFGSAPPAATRARSMTYLELQGLGDGGEPRGNRYFTKSCYLADLPAEAAQEFCASAREIKDRRSSIDFEYLGGAITNIPDEKSAFPGRLAPYIFTASAQWTDIGRDAENIAWSRRSVDRLGRFEYGGVYVNYVQGESESKPLEIYGPERYRQLAAIKDRYDPNNIFCHNQNISPALTGAAP